MPHWKVGPLQRRIKPNIMYKLANNPGQNTENTFAALVSETGCCDDAQTPCKYSVTHNFSTALKSVEVDGTVYPFTATATTGTAAKAEVEAILESLGYVDVDSTGVRVTNTTGTTWLVEVYTEATIGKFVNASDVDVSVTAECVGIAVCDYKVTLAGGNLGDVSDGTNSDTLGNNPYSFTGTPATDDATAAQLGTDLAASLGNISWVYKSVTVARNDSASGYDILIRGEYGQTLTINDTTVPNCLNCQDDFKA